MDYALIALGIVVFVLVCLEIRRLWTSRASAAKADIGRSNDISRASSLSDSSSTKPKDAKVVSKRKSRPLQSSSQSSDTDSAVRHSKTSNQHKRGNSSHSKQQHAHSHTHSSSTSIQYGQGSRPSGAYVIYLQ